MRHSKSAPSCARHLRLPLCWLGRPTRAMCHQRCQRTEKSPGGGGGASRCIAVRLNVVLQVPCQMPPLHGSCYTLYSVREGRMPKYRMYLRSLIESALLAASRMLQCCKSLVAFTLHIARCMQNIVAQHVGSRLHAATLRRSASNSRSPAPAVPNVRHVQEDSPSPPLLPPLGTQPTYTTAHSTAVASAWRAAGSVGGRALAGASARPARTRQIVTAEGGTSHGEDR